MAFELVVGIGGDGSGYEAARTAARVAGMLDGGSIVLVFGYEASVPGPRGGALEDQIASVGAVSTSAIHEELTAAHPQLHIEVELVHDRPVESLIRVAQARGAGAIVVGHGDRGPMAGALLGSITYEIVHRSPIPVLVVPSDD
jgi:nucleotide-binding universal stress UspA family protein